MREDKKRAWSTVVYTTQKIQWFYRNTAKELGISRSKLINTIIEESIKDRDFYNKVLRRVKKREKSKKPVNRKV